MAFREGVRNCRANGRATVRKGKSPAGNVYNVGTLKSNEQRNSHE